MIRQEFAVHRLNTDGLARADDLAEVFSDCLNKVQGLVPPGREFALVVTKLQEAAFFAKRGMALAVNNQQQEN